MFESIWRGLTGRWGMLALIVALTPTGRKITKTAVKELVRVGVTASEKVREITAEIREESSDILAEIKEERAAENGSKNNHNSKKESAAT
jgi:hypothetical protein